MIRALCVAVAIAVAAVGVAPTASADPYDDLWGMLPSGYGPESCYQPEEPYKGALATLQCYDNYLTAGPTYAVYFLYGDGKRMATDYSVALKAVTLVPCPGGIPSPTDWTGGPMGQVLGRVACAKKDDAPALLWTNDSKRLFAYAEAEGVELTDLYAWWRNNPGI